VRNGAPDHGVKPPFTTFPTGGREVGNRQKI
jgi:hypothetical protein